MTKTTSCSFERPDSIIILTDFGTRQSKIPSLKVTERGNGGLQAREDFFHGDVLEIRILCLAAQGLESNSCLITRLTSFITLGTLLRLSGFQLSHL